jgi:hypothetical protein
VSTFVGKTTSSCTEYVLAFLQKEAIKNQANVKLCLLINLDWYSPKLLVEYFLKDFGFNFTGDIKSPKLSFLESFVNEFVDYMKLVVKNVDN